LYIVLGLVLTFHSLVLFPSLCLALVSSPLLPRCAHVTCTQVNYVGKGGRLYQPGEAISGSASVVARALRTGYLWDTVRMHSIVVLRCA